MLNLCQEERHYPELCRKSEAASPIQTWPTGSGSYQKVELHKFGLKLPIIKFQVPCAKSKKEKPALLSNFSSSETDFQSQLSQLQTRTTGSRSNQKVELPKSKLKLLIRDISGSQ